MTYEKKTWVETDPLHYDDLNHIESQNGLVLTELSLHDETGHPDRYYTKPEMNSYFWNPDNMGPSSSLNADTLGGLHAEDISSGIPAGFMGWWDARNGAIPTGHIFCDGNNSTLDMRGRFPVGAAAVGVGATGGNSAITPEGSVIIGTCALTPMQILHYHMVTQLYAVNGGPGGSGGGTMYPGYVWAHQAWSRYIELASAGGSTPHNHPGLFAGDSVSMLPLFNWLVVIQKS